MAASANQPRGKDPRRGEKLGWTIGWLGAFCWLPLIGGILVVNGEALWGTVACFLALVGIVLVVVLSPWRHPGTRFWKLMIPIYAVLLASAVLLAALMMKTDPEHLEWMTLLWLLPVLMPLVSIGNRRWAE